MKVKNALSEFFDIAKWCDPDGIRNLDKPFLIDGIQCATNSHCFVVSTIESSLENGDGTEHVKQTIRNAVLEMISKDFRRVNTVTLPEKERCFRCSGRGLVVVCEECEGDGEVELENDFNTYVCECRSCDGNGRAPAFLLRDKESAIQCSECYGRGVKFNHRGGMDFHGSYIQPKYAELINGMPGLQVTNIQLGQSGPALAFIAEDDNGEIILCGVIMELRR